DPRFLAAVIPSGNIVATADELCRFFQLLLAGGSLDGVAVFAPRTLPGAMAEPTYLEIDFPLHRPGPYGVCFVVSAGVGRRYGPVTRHAFGQLGFTNVLCWADPERDLAAAVLTSGKPLVYTGLWWLWQMLAEIGRTCAKAASS